MNHPIDHLNPLTDRDAASAVSAAARDELLEHILEHAPVAAVRRPHPSRRPRPARRAGLRIGAVVALAAVVAALLLVLPSTRVGRVDVGPGRAQALSFVTHHGYTTVIVRNPLASPATFRHEFAVHHLQVNLQLVPASPSLVGTMVEASSGTGVQILPITAHRACLRDPVTTCPVGVRIPVGYHGSVNIAFGRAARPGEQYETTATAGAPGEMLHGVPYKGRTVGWLRHYLAARHESIAQYRYDHDNYGYALHAGQVPDRWVVIDADPWALDQLLIEVQPPPR